MRVPPPLITRRPFIAASVPTRSVTRWAVNLTNFQHEAVRRDDVSGVAVTPEQRQSADTAVLVAEASLTSSSSQ